MSSRQWERGLYSDDDSSKLLALQLTAKPLEALGTLYIQSTASCMIQLFVACRYSPCHCALWMLWGGLRRDWTARRLRCRFLLFYSRKYSITDECYAAADMICKDKTSKWILLIFKNQSPLHTVGLNFELSELPCCLHRHLSITWSETHTVSDWCDTLHTVCKCSMCQINSTLHMKHTRELSQATRGMTQYFNEH